MGNKGVDYKAIIELVRDGEPTKDIASVVGCSESTVGFVRLTLNALSDMEPVEITPISKFTPRELMAELAKRGYRGKLEYVQTIDITNF